MERQVFLSSVSGELNNLSNGRVGVVRFSGSVPTLLGMSVNKQGSGVAQPFQSLASCDQTGLRLEMFGNTLTAPMGMFSLRNEIAGDGLRLAICPAEELLKISSSEEEFLVPQGALNCTLFSPITVEEDTTVIHYFEFEI